MKLRVSRTRTIYPRSKRISTVRPFGKADKGSYLSRPMKVGSYAPNKAGLYDMHGNVLQWYEDLHDPKYNSRMIRGGNWGLAGAHCQAAERGWDAPEWKVNVLGFRLARVPVR